MVLLSLGVLYKGYGVPGLRLILAFLGMVMVLCLSFLLSRYQKWSWIHIWGQYSLDIFVAHTLATAGVRIGLIHGVHVYNPGIHIVAGIAAGMAFPLLVGALARRWGIRSVFVWGR